MIGAQRVEDRLRILGSVGDGATVLSRRVRVAGAGVRDRSQAVFCSRVDDLPEGGCKARCPEVEQQYRTAFGAVDEDLEVTSTCGAHGEPAGLRHATQYEPNWLSSQGVRPRDESAALDHKELRRVLIDWLP